MFIISFIIGAIFGATTLFLTCVIIMTNARRKWKDEKFFNTFVEAIDHYTKQ